MIGLDGATEPTAPITYVTFKRLQERVDDLPDSFTWGSHSALPEDRSPLENIYTTELVRPLAMWH